MNIATLGIIVQEGHVLLGEKKKGEIGVGVLSGPGGKQEPGEALKQCIYRETLEEYEIRLHLRRLELVSIITFFAGGIADYKVYIYRTDAFFGKLHETKDTKMPQWYPLDNLPFHSMYESDHEWFAKVARGEKFNAHVYYKDRARDFGHIEFLPFSPLTLVV